MSVTTATMMCKLCAYEAAALADLAATDIVHVPLEEYTQGSEHYERLIGQIEQARRCPSPEEIQFNF